MVQIFTKNSSYTGKFAKIILSDGTTVDGEGFGYPTTVFGELVFNTGMTGYVEALTDPSYGGQLLTLTYPLVGNYGVPDPSLVDEFGITKYFESNKIQARALIIHSLSNNASHWNLSMTLDEWMYKEKIPGISNIDTRMLTQKIRKQGVMMAGLIVSDEKIDVSATNTLSENLTNTKLYDDTDFVSDISTPKPVEYGSGKPIIVIDTGVKNAILRNICSMGYRAVVVPWNTSFQTISSLNPYAVVISSGPGDPQKCSTTINTAKELINHNIPTLGICLGAQIIAIAGGAQTYKLKYGHRGQNKPCMDMLDEGKVYVTSQNHGYCIDSKSLNNTDFDIWFTNVDDNTIEGIKSRNKKCLAVQFHPEASPGPFDCKFIFDQLRHIMEEENPAQK